MATKSSAPTVSNTTVSDDSLPSVCLAPSIDDLPNELLSHIFSYLDFVEQCRCEAVSRRWRQIGNRPKQLVLSDHFLKNGCLDDSVVTSILSQRGKTLKKLAIKSCPLLTCRSITSIGRYCPNLEVMELVFCSTGDEKMECLKILAPDCPNLKTIRVESDCGTKTFNEALFAIAQYCRCLECLDVAQLPLIDLPWLEIINPGLRSLCLNVCDLTSDDMYCLMKRCWCLEKFVLYGCGHIENDMLILVLQHFRHTLSVLRISNQHSSSSDVDWREGLKSLINLNVLQLIRCQPVDDDLMVLLAHNCSKLEVLDFSDSDVTDRGLLALHTLSCLRELRIGRKTKITEYGLKSLVAEGVIKQVIYPSPSYNSDLAQACLSLAVLYPKVHFVQGQEGGRSQDQYGLFTF